MPRESCIHYYAEVLTPGRAVLRRDLVLDGNVISTEQVGSPAPEAVVREHERKVILPMGPASWRRRRRG